jgi:8-oxo-dGTP diphosphatase
MDRPKVGVGVIVMRDDKILLGKRKGSHGEGTWCFPGGHLEGGESFYDCTRRETKEETGLEIKIIEEIPITTNDIFLKEDKHYVTVFIRANYMRGEPRIMEPEKCEDWQWFYWDNLPEKLFIPIQNLIKQRYNPFRR